MNLKTFFRKFFCGKENKKKFIGGISYKEHRKRAQETYKTEVLPLLKKERRLNIKNETDIINSLTPEQKAHMDMYHKRPRGL